MSSADDEHEQEENDQFASREITIIYATETGTAQHIADRVAQECRRTHFKVTVENVEKYPPENLISESLVIFVVSTTGSGREPRSMTPLWNMLLRSDLPEDLFEDLSFAVFGLGDTAYEKFCWPAKLLTRRLSALGATEVCNRGEGDEQHHLGIDGAFGPWISQFISSLLELFPLPSGLQPTALSQCPPPRVALTQTDQEALQNTTDPLDKDPRYHVAVLKCNKRITAEDWFQDVRHFELDFEDDIQYQPGDIAIVHPEAHPADVEAVLVSLGYSNSADEPLAIHHLLADQSLPDHLPSCSTLRTLFTRHLDVAAIPRRSFFALLRQFTQDDLEKEKLDEFLSNEGADELYEYCYRPRRTIREVLEEFRSASVPKEYIFDLFPPMRPREFSIASSVKKHPRQVHLCIATVQYKTRLKIPRRGVCTRYLAGLELGDKLRVGLKKGLLSLPLDPDTSVICVGPGTGIAPMRAVIEERTFSGSSANTLYFGCRSATKDRHYHDEWEVYEKKGELVYRVACSRDGPEGTARIYVQDLIREDGERVAELLKSGAWVFISGSSNKMPAGVKAALRDVLKSAGRKTEVEAEAYVADMERQGRLIEECWS